MSTLPLDPGALWPFVVAVSLIELTPGPNMGYLAALSAAEGRAAGFRAVLGVTLGLSVYMLLAVFGVAELIAAAPILYAGLRWAGVLYLFYLAWQAWRGAEGTSPGHSRVADHAPFWRAFIANVLNPKAAVFYVTLLPSFISPERAPFWLQALLLGSLHLLISIVIHTLIVVGAARAGALAAPGPQTTLLRRLMALSIGAIAVWLALQNR